MDQVGFGEREGGRARMSVEEQLERMRRNQEASSLREKRRETPSRSPSFSKDGPAPPPPQVSPPTRVYPGRGATEGPIPALGARVQARAPAEGACADPLELEAALQQLKLAHVEQRAAPPQVRLRQTQQQQQQLLRTH